MRKPILARAALAALLIGVDVVPEAAEQGKDEVCGAPRHIAALKDPPADAGCGNTTARLNDSPDTPDCVSEPSISEV